MIYCSQCKTPYRAVREYSIYQELIQDCDCPNSNPIDSTQAKEEDRTIWTSLITESTVEHSQ